MKINKDVSRVTEHTAVVSNKAASKGVWDKKVTDNRCSKVMGIKVTKLSVWVRSHSVHGKVTKVYNSGSAEKNFTLAWSSTPRTPAPGGGWQGARRDGVEGASHRARWLRVDRQEADGGCHLEWKAHRHTEERVRG
ncbi:hypothetical protein [Streptomyces sp. NBC_00648]|uniref:hypothetical protein n=1 Tax=Streptomyces sp. NBC_00648 TaxID=2975797 RepID=UPI003247744B